MQNGICKVRLALLLKRLQGAFLAEYLAPATTMPQLRNLPYCVLYLFTWPYYGTLVRYTIEPLERIAAPQKDLLELSERVRDFALGKGEELKYISFAVCPLFFSSLSILAGLF